ncbi:disease resistance protein RGA2-like [Papaver somniferum]|uniref:disease resistance protein RGA2-like n=1 Tax=Papaver somniferum TaxID=3469 RepID=UPI000E6F58F0|nr:disease resistance protein RGA2-like [Papaver somniferum]
MWNENSEQWENLKSVLLDGASGSKILITTRNDQVASIVRGSIPPYNLDQLEDDACWSIIKQKAFSPGGEVDAPNMSDIGKQIAKQCGGLPLAAKFLGSLLHLKKKESDWISIRDDDIWNTPDNKRKILSTLNVSSCENLKSLPECVKILHNLEVLDLKDCLLIKTLPKDLGELIHLRYLSLSNTDITVFPESCANLVNIEHVFFLLVTEKMINETDHNEGMEELGNLNFFDKLTIFLLGNVKDPNDAERANIKGKQNFRELTLLWGTVEESSDTMWDEKSCNFQLETEKLPAAIGQLPRLRYLDLDRLSFECLDIVGFPSFTNLFLTDMFDLEDIFDSHPCLQQLGINECEILTEVPSFPSLRTLKLDNIDLQLVSSVGRTHTSLTSLSFKNVEELIYFPANILQNNCNLQYLEILECNQLQGFRVNEDDDSDDEVTLLSSEVYTISLQELVFRDCAALKFLPELRGWTSLQKLTIFNCPQVKESLTYDLKSLSPIWKDCMLILFKRTSRRSQKIYLT